MKRNSTMSDHTEKSGAMQAQLKKKLMNSWDHMKKRYPVVRSVELVSGDAAKEEFLRSIDGLKSAEEIACVFYPGAERGAPYLFRPPATGSHPLSGRCRTIGLPEKAESGTQTEI